MYKRHIVGEIGEKIANKYLVENGYQIIKKNFRCKQGEIDIIAKDKNEIVFVEVKTRKHGTLIKPEEYVDKFKINHIRNCATHYIQHNNLEEYDISFDIISITVVNTKMILKHIRNCEI